MLDESGNYEHRNNTSDDPAVVFEKCGYHTPIIPQAVDPRRLGLASRIAVAMLGLATASRSHLLARHRSGVRVSSLALRFRTIPPQGGTVLKCGPEETRTPYLVNANDALYQMSYGPKNQQKIAQNVAFDQGCKRFISVASYLLYWLFDILFV